MSPAGFDGKSFSRAYLSEYPYLNCYGNFYHINMLARVKDQRMIKVVTGVRRCGKSTLLQMFRQELMDQGIPEVCCLTVNFEDIRFEYLKEYHRLYDYILERLVPQQKNYISLDEIQAVSQFQKAVGSLFLREDVVTRKRVSDVPVLEAVVRFLLDNIGNIVSVKRIADSLTSDGRKTTPVTCDREFAPLKAIPDNLPKQVLTLDEFPMGEDGINQKTVVEFLLEGKS